MPTRTLTVMFTDIKGFTSRTSEETRNGMTRFLQEHNRLLIPVFKYYQGTIVKTIGDAFLVYFESPTDAVLCGVTIQEVLRRHNEAVDEKGRVEVRVAINLGEVELTGNDILGEAVNIASRLEGIAEPGQVFFTDAVYQTMNRQEAPSAEIGERIFKGIPNPVRVYKVIDDPDSTFRQAVSRSVGLSERGPVLTGLRQAVSETDRVIAQAAGLMQIGAYTDALKLLHAQLLSDPSNKELLSKAVEAARRGADAMAGAGEYQKALEWLRQEAGEKSYLNVLRPEMAALDVKAAVAAVTKDPGFDRTYYHQPLKELLARHPQDPQVPYTAARMLEEKAPPMTALWLFREALERGGCVGDEHILEYCTGALSSGRLDYDIFRKADGILRQFYREKRREWALEAMQTGGAQAILNAWQVLEDEKDPLIRDPYFSALHDLVRYQECDIDAVYAVLQQESDEGRRRRIVALHEEIVSTYPKFTVFGAKRDAVADSLRKLTRTWASPPS